MCVYTHTQSLQGIFMAFHLPLKKKGMANMISEKQKQERID